jgi:hypothetical protein
MSVKLDRITAFLNTSLGIWFLSTVAVGGISFFYSQMSSYLTERSRKRAQIERLHIEIINRLIQYAGHSEEIEEHSNYDSAEPHEDLSDATIALIAPPSTLKDSKYPIYAAFSEYSGRPIASLLVEIAFLLNQDQRKKLEPKLETFTALTPERIRRMSAAELREEMSEMFFEAQYWKRFFE